MRLDTTQEAGSGAGGTIEPAVLTKTPTRNESLCHETGGFSTIADGLDYAARGETGMNFYGARGQLDSVLSYAQLRRDALDTAHRLLNAGLRPGDRVAVVAETGPHFMQVFFGCQYAGLIPCPLPYSIYIGGRDSFVSRIAGMLESAHAAAAICGSDLHDHVVEASHIAGTPLVLTHDELARMACTGADLQPFGPEDVAYIQYSSGSTSEPKGVLISQKAICTNTTSILRHGLKAVVGDRAFSWLPLYHDMGLVGFCLSPLMGQFSIDYMATTAFARRPALWLKLMSDNQCTVAFAPTFGYDLAARRINGDAAMLKLDQWRVAGIGGDMVRADVLDLFCDVLCVAGFKRKAFLPSYGMAECTLAASFIDPDAEFETDSIDRLAMKELGIAKPAIDADDEHARRFVVCGKPLPGHEMRVVDEAGTELGNRQIGRIEFRGPSLMNGYFENDEATSEIMRADGYMDTGDMGYWVDDQIVITGRAKDMILCNGRNIWPQDIEWAVEKLDGVRDGDVAAFAVEDVLGNERVNVLVQCRARQRDDIEALRQLVQSEVRRTMGLEADVVMVPPKSLPFTSSGKLSRAGARKMFLDGVIREIVPDGKPVSLQPVAAE